MKLRCNNTNVYLSKQLFPYIRFLRSMHPLKAVATAMPRLGTSWRSVFYKEQFFGRPGLPKIQVKSYINRCCKPTNSQDSAFRRYFTDTELQSCKRLSWRARVYFERRYSSHPKHCEGACSESGKVERYVTWLEVDTVIGINDIVMSGGMSEHLLYDKGMLQSSVSRPKQYWFYNDIRDLYLLAVYATEGIAMSHCFFNSNKRTAMIAGLLFLKKNGIDTPASEDFADMMVKLVTHQVSVGDFAQYLENLASKPSDSILKAFPHVSQQ